MIDNELASCPHCGSFAIQPTGKPDEETGQCEYWCEDCGEYFADAAPLDEDSSQEVDKRE